MVLDRYGMGVKCKDKIFYVGDEIILRSLSGLVGIKTEIKMILWNTNIDVSGRWLTFIVSIKIGDEMALRYLYDVARGLYKGNMPFFCKGEPNCIRQSFQEYLNNFFIYDIDEVIVTKPFYLRSNVPKMEIVEEEF